MPNHGFRVDLGGNQFINMYADYNGIEEPNTEEALTDFVDICYQHKFKKYCGGSITISNLPGFRVIGTAVTENGERIVDYIKIQRTVKGKTSDTLIRYYFQLCTSPKNYPKDVLVFSRLVDGFKTRQID